MSCTTASQKSRDIASNQIPAHQKINQAFTYASKIQFYSYGDLENYPYHSNSFPYCGASAAVISDQLYKKFKMKPLQVFIYFTDVYSNYCNYPTAYEGVFHTFSALKDDNGVIYAIDPAHMDKAYDLKTYLQKYTEQDCKKVSIEKMDLLARKIKSKAVFDSTINNSNGSNPTLEIVRNIRNQNLDLIKQGKLEAFPPSGYNGFAYNAYPDSKFLRDRHFLYVFILEQYLASGAMSAVDQSDQGGFINNAYSWVYPGGLPLKKPKYYNEAKKPFVNQKNFQEPK